MTQKEIDKIRKELENKERTPEEEITYAEVCFRDHMISYLAYGDDYLAEGESHERSRKWCTERLEKAGVKDPYKRAKELWEEMVKDFNEKATIKYGVYEDSEGCIYNRVEWND